MFIVLREPDNQPKKAYVTRPISIAKENEADLPSARKYTCFPAPKLRPGERSRPRVKIHDHHV
ncbi:MAG: hypothetical protein Q8O92_08835 [Candidatus Latescibacter sp.]|nr:hypothetical protein [Candidatus Latescibacter sp.]